MSKVNKTKMGIIQQLHSMLTNHPDRPVHMLNVSLTDADGILKEETSFEIYANDPVTKIEEKVDKMRLKGGMTTLRISEIEKVKDCEYALILSV